MSIITRILIIPIMLFFVTCSSNGDKSNDLIVCVSIPPLADFAKNIVGNRAIVHTLIPAGSTPHSFEPTPASMKLITNSDIFVRVGNVLKFEEILLNKIDREKIGDILDISEFIKIENNDPHIWLSPLFVREIMDTMLNTISKKLPQHRLYFNNNKNEYIRVLDSIDFAMSKILENKKERYLFVYHPAWKYFANYYDLEQLTIEKNGKSPKARDMKLLINDALEKDVSCIFFDPYYNENPVATIARELNLNTDALNPLPDDYLSNLIDISIKLDKHLK